MKERDSTALLHGFSPVATPESRVLVLGSMPGMVSLEERQYYAHPRNAFWPIAGHWLGFDPLLPYGERVSAIVRTGVALWDVLRSCSRKSSLDTDIDPATIVPNDLAGFLARHRRIRRICFNGAQAEIFYLRFGFRELPGAVGIEHVRLPSTSPANAAMSLDAKREAWQPIRP